MPRLSQPRATRPHNPSLPDTGSVVVNLEAGFDPMAEKPPILIYGSSTPQAQAFQKAEADKTLGVTPVAQRTEARLRAAAQPEVETERSPAVAYVDEFDGDEPDPTTTLRNAEERARKRDKERLRQVETENAQLRNWGQTQANAAANATHAVATQQLDTIANALAAAEAEVEAAEAAYAEAWAKGDGLGVAKATRLIGTASNKIETLKAGQDELEQQVRVRPQPAQPPLPANNVEAVIAQFPNLSPAERDWIRQHPDSVSPQKQRKLVTAFEYHLSNGVERGSPEFFDAINKDMGYQEDGDGDGDEPGEIETVQPARRQVATRRVAAPVSHSNGGMRGPNLKPGQIQLTQAMREAARISGVSETDYAKGVARLREQKAAGMYGMSEQK